MRLLRHVPLLVLLGAVWFALYYARVAHVSRAEFALGAAAERAPDLRSAVVHHRRALRHFAPPFDASSEAEARLFAIAEGAARRGDDTLALFAYRAVRGGILSARSVVPHGGTSLARANRSIARLSARAARAPEFRNLDASQVEAALLAELEREPHERPFFVLMSTFGFALFVAFAHAALVRRDDDPPTAFSRHRWLGVVGFVSFLVGAYLA